ncbi:killer cell lectin like receptor D1 [Phyllostomus discolor]|uniref:Natural killer cells antigen CD94 n=1 Tax=Phyllostomus discolor TaxID=89673 RepID=A0A7E6D7I3_9CHIR|nr:natural killer cells antigen CD94-like [Phyllostomus discolor]XP_035875241.1 natural killer cells antigen CD94-like [Phyllostomus discolor]KAF6119330.1 killer cell lectin like receptor D1 [Phyllostomus discolor]
MAASRTTPWRLISGIIGVMCLVLMATLGILLSNAFKENAKGNVQPTSSPGPTTEPLEGCGCYSCQEKWIGFQCNCFFISNERKTWAESRDICASRNSSLLQLRNRSEMDFLKFSKTFYWIGLSYSEERRVWLWEDGSALSRDLFSPFPTLNTKHCVLYGTRNSVLDESCQEQNPYICKQQLI